MPSSQEILDFLSAANLVTGTFMFTYVLISIKEYYSGRSLISLNSGQQNSEDKKIKIKTPNEQIFEILLALFWFSLTFLGAYNDITNEPMFRVILSFLKTPHPLYYIGLIMGVPGTVLSLVYAPYLIIRGCWNLLSGKTKRRDPLLTRVIGEFDCIKNDEIFGFMTKMDGLLVANAVFAGNYRVLVRISFTEPAASLEEILSKPKELFKKLEAQDLKYRMQLALYIKEKREFLDPSAILDTEQIARNLMPDSIWFRFKDAAEINDEFPDNIDALLGYENLNDFGEPKIRVDIDENGEHDLEFAYGYLTSAEEDRLNEKEDEQLLAELEEEGFINS